MPENPDKSKYNEEEERRSVAKAKAKKNPRDADPETLRKEGFTSEDVELMTKFLSLKKTPREFGVLKHDQGTGAGIIGDVKRELPQKETLSREQLVSIAKKFGMTDQSIGELTDEWVETVLKPHILSHELKKYPTFLQNNKDLEHRVKEIENNIIQQARTLGIPHETIFNSNTFELYDEIKERLELIRKGNEEKSIKKEDIQYEPGVVKGPMEKAIPEAVPEIAPAPKSEEGEKKRTDQVLAHYEVLQKVLQSLLRKAYFRPEDEKKYLEHYGEIRRYYADPKNSGDKNFTNNKINFELADYLGKFYQKQPTTQVLGDLLDRKGLADASPSGKVIGELKAQTGPAAKTPEFKISIRSAKNQIEVQRRNNQNGLLETLRGFVRDAESGKVDENAGEIFNKTAAELLDSYEESRKADARPQIHGYIKERVDSLARLSKRFDKLANGGTKQEHKKGKKPDKARKFDNGTGTVFTAPSHSEKKQNRQAARREKATAREATYNVPKEEQPRAQRPSIDKSREIPHLRVVESKRAEVPAEAPKIDMKTLESEIRQKALVIKDYIYGKYPNLTVEEKRGKIKELFTIYQTKLLERLKEVKKT